LGDFVSVGEVWEIVKRDRGRIELVLLEPAGKKRKYTFLEHTDRLRDLGFQLPDRKPAPVKIPTL